MIREDLDECQVVAGIKPIKNIQEGKTYMMYSRLASGVQSLKEYAKVLKTKKACVIDYERIRDQNDQIIVGSSQLAGFVGAFNSFRILGEYLLLRKLINTPFLHMGGSAYMHRDKNHCIESLKQAFADLIDKQGGLPKEICPFIIGVTGRGAVAKGVYELI